MRRVFVVAYRRFGQIIGPIFKGQAVQLEVPRSQVLLAALPLRMGLMVCAETSVTTTNLRRDTTQKSEDLIYALQKPEV